ncbi:PDR/VanB family oxidoreductase [Williamsia muralis]|uniref:PDR/VanB family oxidoreductase n=1 Tax=Williamsia marianensis TaxID=85044 RepID=UPI0038083379
MNYLPPPSTDVDNPTPVLDVLGRIARRYSHLFAESQYAETLSPPKPVRRIGFEYRLMVQSNVPAGSDVRVITLSHPQGTALPRWTPGAHIDVFTEAKRQRHYSLTGDPNDTTAYRIAVRRIPNGLGSAEMHNLRPGQALQVRGPRNAFNFAPSGECLFIAGGIGITPILPMVRAAAARGIDWTIVYTGRSRSTMPFIDELVTLGSDRVVIQTDDENGPPDVQELMSARSGQPATYLCGPSAMIDAARNLVAREQPGRELHTERFSPPAVVNGRPFRIDFSGGGSVNVAADETALAAIRRVRPDVRYSCQQGFCGACRIKVLDGIVEHHDRVLIGDERADSMMICVSRAAGDHVAVDF